MLEAGAPVPYVQAQVGDEDPTTTLQIYAQVLKRRDRRRHGEAFDALMADAVPSAASIIMRGNPDRPEGRGVLDMPSVSGGSGHRNELSPESVTSFYQVRHMTIIRKIWPFAGLSQSRRPDSNRGPLHYE